MNVAPTNRSAQLAQIPPEDRALVEYRMREWDRLAPEVQKQLLENEATIRYFTELRDSQGYRTNTISAARRDKLERGIQQWQALVEADRQRIANLSLEERHQFLKNAERWELMTPDERQAWRELVKSIPLLPSNVRTAPVPPTPPPRPRTAAVATKGG